MVRASRSCFAVLFGTSTRLPDLRWVHALSAGVERVIRPEMAERGIILTNSAGAYSRAMAESVLASILAVAKCLPEHVRNQQEGIWRTYSKVELRGKTLGVLGLGSIGRDAAGLARCLGMRTIGTLRHPRALPGIDAVYASHEAARVAAESDFLLVAAPSTPATQCLVDEAVLCAMRPTAWLINVARGSLVDEKALLRALDEGRLAGACLDVFEREPLPSDHPFWHMANVLVTPHNSAYSRESFERATELFLDNVARFAAGQPLRNVVDLEAGY